MARLRRIKTPDPFKIGAILVVGLAIGALQQWRPDWFEKPAEQESLEPGTYRLARVVDGDTFVLAGSKEHVRLIGADTPETVKPNWPVEPWGPEASAFSHQFLSGGVVRLEFDKERRDKYGRLLAYAWVGDRMLNEELIRAGLARAEMQFRYDLARKSLFRRAEAAAKAAKRGIWSSAEP